MVWSHAAYPVPFQDCGFDASSWSSCLPSVSSCNVTETISILADPLPALALNASCTFDLRQPEPPPHPPPSAAGAQSPSEGAKPELPPQSSPSVAAEIVASTFKPFGAVTSPS